MIERYVKFSIGFYISPIAGMPTFSVFKIYFSYPKLNEIYWYQILPMYFLWLLHRYSVKQKLRSLCSVHPHLRLSDELAAMLSTVREKLQLKLQGYCLPHLVLTLCHARVVWFIVHATNEHCLLPFFVTNGSNKTFGWRQDQQSDIVYYRWLQL